jgi:hypothetical protein
VLGGDDPDDARGAAYPESPGLAGHSLDRGGTEAVWLPPIGDPEEVHQHELLLLPGIETRIVAVDVSGQVPIVKVEVSDG